MFDGFGKNDPRKMPSYLFSGSLYLDFASAVNADISKQNYSICPRYWYVDATIHCGSCGVDFCFAADEQRVWYEEYAFWIDSFPKCCKDCRRVFRDQMELRKEYDREITKALKSDDCAVKERIVAIIDQLCDGLHDFPEKIQENRRLLAKQIERLRGAGAA